MRIISKFRDYYDGVQALDQDRDTVYVRHPKDVDLPKSVFPELHVYFRPVPSAQLPIDLDEYIVGFCGRIYPCLRIKETITKPFKYHPYHEREYKHTYCYSIDCLDSFIIDHYRPFVFDQYSSEKYVPHATWPMGAQREEFVKWFNKCKEKQTAFTKYFVDNQCPIFSFTPPVSHGGVYRLQLNCSLSAFGFQKLKDSFTTYQDLRMYYEGVLAHPGRPIPDVPDNIMVEAKGFDKKFSFRKDPSTKKRRK